MLHDLVIVGAGPVGATLALALADSDLDVVTLDARPAGTIARSDRSLALSHGARLIFERLDVWSEVAARPGAVTPITAIDISQRGGFGRARLYARDHGVDALGYVVSYRALQHALDAALARAGTSIEHGVGVTRVSASAASARVVGEREAPRSNGAHVWPRSRMAVAMSWTTSRDSRHDYRQARAGGENLVQRTPRRTRVRALHRPGSDGTPARRRPLRLGVDDNSGKCQRAGRTFGTIVLGGARAALRALRRAMDP